MGLDFILKKEKRGGGLFFFLFFFFLLFFFFFFVRCHCCCRSTPYSKQANRITSFSFLRFSICRY